MNYKPKPKYYSYQEKIVTFLFTMIFIGVAIIVAVLSDMVINGLSGDDKPSDFFFAFLQGITIGSPFIWFGIHKYPHLKFYFKEYLPWKKYNAKYQAHHDELKLNHERRLTEVFIRQVRK